MSAGLPNPPAFVLSTGRKFGRPRHFRTRLFAMEIPHRVAQTIAGLRASGQNETADEIEAAYDDDDAGQAAAAVEIIEAQTEHDVAVIAAQAAAAVEIEEAHTERAVEVAEIEAGAAVEAAEIIAAGIEAATEAATEAAVEVAEIEAEIEEEAPAPAPVIEPQGAPPRDTHWYTRPILGRK